MVQRLTEIESLAYLKSHGYNISVQTLRVNKKKIRDSRFTRMRTLADTGYIDYHLDGIDTIEWIKKEMVSNYYQVLKKDPYKATEILTQIANLSPFLAEHIAETKEVMTNKVVSQLQATEKENPL